MPPMRGTNADKTRASIAASANVLPSRIILVAGLAGPLLLGVMLWAQLATYPYDWDPGEGDNIQYAWQLANGEPIYGDYSTYPMTGSCYPPLYHLLVAPLVAGAGWHVVCGRAVSCVATLITAGLISYIVRSGGGYKWAAAIASLIYLAMPFTSQWGGLARVDATMTCLSLASFVVLATGRASLQRAVAGALLGVLAGLTKPYGVLLPAGGLFLLALRSRRLAMIGAATAIAVGVFALVSLQWWSSGWFWNNVVSANATGYSPGRVVRLIGVFLATHVFVAGWAAAALIRPGNEGRAIPAVLLASGLATSLFIGKLGGSMNYLLPLSAALALSCGLAGARARGKWVYVFSISILAQGVLWMQSVPVLAPGPAERAAMDEAASRLRVIPGSVLIERHVCLQRAAGQSMYWEPCLLSFVYGDGKWDPGMVVKDLRAAHYSAVFTSGKFLVPPVREALHRAYLPTQEEFLLPDWTGGARYQLFLPRATATRSAPG